MENTNGHVEGVRRSIDAFNLGDPAGYAAHYADDARLIGPTFPEPLVGRDAIYQATVAANDAFSDMRWEVLTLLEDGSSVACELHIEGTHDGPLATPAGEIPPTGRRVSFDALEILEFDGNGLIAEHREYMDTATFVAQLCIGED